ncbi:hypothetical protein [Halomonas sp. hl-4]|uniref:hypothetical protein n=1 Tax=Halomonas sp. hl-4 TaxID=1761789 RepID=UPI000BB7DBF0|nr:hypothetical protein [Halomonas sp. hl-4]SNY95545.1 hypothetical protein SAMN04488142_0045 [Halomonas sp. hl-4]
MNLSVQLFRAGVPDNDPIRVAIERVHVANEQTHLSPEEQGHLIGRAALALDREIARVNKQYGIEVSL